MSATAKKAKSPVSPDRFAGTPGEIVSIENLNLDFSARLGKKSIYDDLLDKLAAAPKNSAIRFGDLKCRPSVAVRAKKRGYLIQFAESAGSLYVRITGSASEDLKEVRRQKITAILRQSPLTYIKVANRLRESGDEMIDAATVERILTQMRKAGEVIVQEGGAYALNPAKPRPVS
jgi:hypothetical protein